MAHGSASNFIRQTVGSSVATNDPETIDVSDASAFPDPSTSQYDIVIWDAGSFNRPDQDSDVEVLTVTARDTTAETLTCARGQQGTANTSHPNTSDVIIAPLSIGDFNTVRSQLVDTSGLSHNLEDATGVSGSRSAGTTFTNNTGHVIYIVVFYVASSSSDAIDAGLFTSSPPIDVPGSGVINRLDKVQTTAGTSSDQFVLSGIVPDGNEYRVEEFSDHSGFSINSWTEREYI